MGSLFLENEKTLIINGQERRFLWSYKKIYLPYKLISFVECNLQCGELKAQGYGEAFRFGLAKKKSFSEAWERFWMRHINELSPNLKMPNFANSNGFASHPDPQVAELNSKLELIERAEILSSWQKPEIWKRKECFLLRGLIRFLRAKIGKECDFEFYSVSSFKDYETRIGLLIGTDYGIYFDASCFQINFLSSFSRIKNDIKILRILFRTMPFFPFRMESLTDMPIEGTPTDHLNFYRNPAHIQAFNIHRNKSGSGHGLLSDCEAVKTITLYNGPAFPAVCISSHPDWPNLCWGKSSMKPDQVWPHPIA